MSIYIPGSKLLPMMFTSSLSLIATSYSLRCDAKYADTNVLEIDKRIRDADHFELGYFLPRPFVKGIQPNYLDATTEDSVPVINTLSIQKMTINPKFCRHFLRTEYEVISTDKQLQYGDVLLTMDGGVSIGKPVLFDLEGDYTVDSHVCILKPEGITPIGLVYILASPMGQMQFRRAESGASGQTNVTEEDIRRFIFPTTLLENLDAVVAELEEERSLISQERLRLEEREQASWQILDKYIR